MATDAEFSILRRFNEKADKLIRSRFVHQIYNEKSGVRIAGSPENGVIVEWYGPDDDAIDAFVLTSRFFIQDNEQTSLRKMSNLYREMSVNEELLRKFEYGRKKLDQFLRSDTFINMDGKILTYGEVFDVFFYGDLAHANPRKRAFYELWNSNPLGFPMVKNGFMMSLELMFRVIRYLRQVNEEIIQSLSKTK